MSITLSVERRWSLKPNETLRLLPIQTSRMISVAHAVSLFVGSILLLGIPFLLNPKLIDVIYYEFYHHKKIVRCPKPPFGLKIAMNFHQMKSYLSETGWRLRPPDSLKTALTSSKPATLPDGKRLKKALDHFAKAQSQKSECYPKAAPQTAPIEASLGSNGPLDYAAALSKGSKEHMEDVILTKCLPIQVNGQQILMPSFILMDGHGIDHLTRLRPPGNPINHYIKQKFFEQLTPYLNTYLKEGFSLEGFYEAFKACLKDLNESYPYSFSGTTFIGVFFIGDMLLCVSIGDSQAALFNHEGPISLNLVADPNSPYFKRKLEKKGIPVNKKGRIGEALNMAAALGDKNIVTPSGARAVYPFMSFTAIPRAWLSSPTRLLIASDGIFDWVPSAEIHETLSKIVDLKEASYALVNLALSRGSTDNISCIVLPL